MTNAIAKKTRRPSSRAAILAAAADLIAEIGAGHLTLEAVAARAGISKGGLLYNFPSKPALLTALIEQGIVEAIAVIDGKEGEGCSAPADFMRAIFDQRAAWLGAGMKGRMAHGMLAAMAEQPAMLDPVRRLQALIWEKMKTVSKDADMLWLVWLAGEGLLLADLFQIGPLSPEERSRVLARLVQEAGRLLDGMDCAGGE